MEHDDWGGDPPLPLSKTPKDSGCGWLLAVISAAVIVCCYLVFG